MTRGGSGDRGEGRGGRSCHSLGGERRKERVLDLPPQRHLRLRRRRAHAHRAQPARRIRPGGHGRASAVGHGREASAGHRRRHHHRHLSLVCRWSRHERCVSLVCPPSSRHSSFYPKVPEQARASAARAASRRRMKILLSTRCQKTRKIRNFHRNPTGIPRSLDPLPDTPVRNFGRQEEARIATASS